MDSQDISDEEKVRRFLYTCNYFGAYISGNLDRYILKFTTTPLFHYIKTSPRDFLEIISSANEDPLLTNRLSLFYIMAEAMHGQTVPEAIKQQIRHAVFKIVKCDDEFFDFVKYFTLLGPKRRHRLTTRVKKMLLLFYGMKLPEEFAQCVTKQNRHHSWAHRDLLKLCCYKHENVSCEIILKYAVYGVTGLPENPKDDSKDIVNYLRKSHELRTTEDVTRAVVLTKELNATIEQVHSKFNKNEEVWLATLPQMTTRQILQHICKFYKLGFLKPGNQFQAKVISLLTDAEQVKKSNVHPVEVFIHFKVFQRGGKAMDPQLLEYLQKKKTPAGFLKKVTEPAEPKCKPVLRCMSRCLDLSYANVQPTGKKFMITIDVSKKVEEFCFQNKKISYLEAAVSLIRYIVNVEKNVSVAVFRDDEISFVQVRQSPRIIEELKEYKPAYIIPSLPINWALERKKQVDVFINFMSCNWLSYIPAEVRQGMETMPDALSKYSKKMRSSDVRLVKIFLGGISTVYSENSRNILAIAGFSAEVPRVLEAFCRGKFS